MNWTQVNSATGQINVAMKIPTRKSINVQSMNCDNYVPQWWVELVVWILTDKWKLREWGYVTKISRRIWLFSANKIESSESFSKQPTQLIIAAHDCHTSLFSLFTWLKKPRLLFSDA